MNSEKLSTPTIEQNEVKGEQSRIQTKNIGKKVLDSDLENNEIDYAPEGYLTADAFSGLIGVSSRTIDLKIKELQIERSSYRDKRNVKCLFLSPEQQQQLRDSLDYLTSVENAPDGYLTVGSFAETIGISKATVGKKMKELQIEGTEYKDKRGIICSFLSPEQQQQIRNSLDYLISAEDVPEGYLTARSFAEKNIISSQVVSQSLKELQITGEEYKNGRGVVNSFLSPEQQQAVLEHLKNRMAVGQEPEGYFSADSFARTIGVDWATVKKKMKELQIEGTEYKDKRGIICSFLSPEQQQQIRNSLDYLISAKKAPDDYISINKLAKEIGVDKATVRKRINDSQIEVFKYKDKRGIICSFLSPEQQQQIRDLLDNKSNIDLVPDGYLTADAFSRELNVGWNVVNAVINELQIEGTEYKDKRGIICSFLSPEQQQQIRNSLDYLISAEDVPEGYLTARSFAEMINIDKATVGKRIKDLQIKGTEYKDKRGIICSFLSPEQQSIILESIENMEAGTSISENVVAFYFEKAGQKIKQGLRPDWLKNPATGRNLEIDIFVDPPGVGIEYDGMYWHQDIGRDMKKDDIAQKSGYRIIHIREDGCPEMPDGSICIKRKDNSSDDDLGESVKKCFQILGLSEPDIDVVRDKKDIMAFMRQRVLDKIDSARTFEELSVVS